MTTLWEGVATSQRNTAFVELDPEDVLVETSDEAFDRLAFAEEALRRLPPSRTTVALCRGLTRVRVETGRAWDQEDPRGRWAILSVPPRASRRAITVAVAALAGPRRAEPYVLDTLLGLT